MKDKISIKCQNCGKTEFKPTPIGTINAMEGYFLVNAYACQNCGHIELFKPELDMYAKQLQEEKQLQQQMKELEQKKQREEIQQRIKELNAIITNEDSTVRQVNEAKKELEKLGAPYGIIQIGGLHSELRLGDFL